MHHRGLDFEVALLVEVVAQGLDDLAADYEGVAHLGVDDQVEVALTVAGLDVFEAMPFLRQRPERFCEDLEAGGLDADLAFIGAEDFALDADEVADVQQAEFLVSGFAEHILAQVKLDAPGHVHQMGEAGLTVAADGHDPPGDSDGLAFKRVKALDDVAGMVGKMIFAAKRLDSPSRDGRQFFAPYAHKLIKFLTAQSGGLIPVIGHIYVLLWQDTMLL